MSRGKPGISKSKVGLIPLIRQGFRRNRGALWSFYFILFLGGVSLLSPFLANDKPIYCQKEGAHYFPVCHDLAVWVGLQEVRSDWRNLNWRKDTLYTHKWFPLIPYSAKELDVRNARYQGPFDEQRVSEPRFWHRLGTDKIGRDVAAGMIAGVRVALLVGFIAMSIATLLGLLLGCLAGYYGDRGLFYRPGRVLGLLIGGFLGVYYGFIYRGTVLAFAANEERWGMAMLISMLVFGAFLLLGYVLGGLLRLLPWLRQPFHFPMDWWVMRGVEVFNAVPGLFLLLAIVAVIDQPSVYYVMVVIGFLRWTTIARFARAEFLQLKELEYIQVGKVLGYSDLRIVWRHMLPNAIGPVVITIAFGMASAILVESALSFLGIGLGTGEISWGVLLREARYNVGAWWLAVFPGLAIFLTVLSFNLLGEGLTDALDPKQIENGRFRERKEI